MNDRKQRMKDMRAEKKRSVDLVLLIAWIFAKTTLPGKTPAESSSLLLCCLACLARPRLSLSLPSHSAVHPRRGGGGGGGRGGEGWTGEAHKDQANEQSASSPLACLLQSSLFSPQPPSTHHYYLTTGAPCCLLRARRPPRLCGGAWAGNNLPLCASPHDA